MGRMSVSNFLSGDKEMKGTCISLRNESAVDHTKLEVGTVYETVGSPAKNSVASLINRKMML